MTASSVAAYTDFNQFAALRSDAEHNDPAAIREVASQFEALFMQMMLKNMRDSSLAEPVFGQSDQHDMYQDMMDKQLSLEMASGKGIGLAEMLVRQLGGEVSEQTIGRPPLNMPRPLHVSAARSQPSTQMRQPTITVSEPKNAPRARVELEPDIGLSAGAKIDPVEFVAEIWPYAKRAALKLNIAPEALLAQAALETGWGAHVMQQSDGSSSFNLFGIKAGNGWTGDSVSKTTLEFEAGVAKPQVARFRAYRDMAATFKDYSELISENPRYESVRNHGDDVEGFAKALQSAGYATDPAYAEKITGVLRSNTMKKAMLNLQTQEVRPINSRLAMEST